jgi:hypothetical protein
MIVIKLVKKLNIIENYKAIINSRSQLSTASDFGNHDFHNHTV